ncbi:MAG: hypothetical protein GY725_00430 [bacterium]|nr:hypothetical protein [bacterium]
MESADGHDRIRAQLTAYVGGQLSEFERARIRAHLDTCSECTAELDRSRDLVGTLSDEDPASWTPSQERFDDIVSRIDDPPSEPGEPPAILQPKRRSPLRTERLAIAGLSALVAALALALFGGGSSSLTPDNSTLSGSHVGSLTGAVARVTFDHRIPESQMSSLLRSVDATIVHGPDSSGQYELAIPSGASVEDVVNTLREDSGVLEAYSLNDMR